MSISASIILYNDLEYLPLAIEHIYDYVDEVVIVDGPYQWMREFLSGLSIKLQSDFSNVYFRGAKLLDDKKVKYHAGSWKDEVAKRTFAYEACSSDLVLVIDADEFFQLNDNSLRDFLDSEYKVAKLNWYSFARTYARCEFPADVLEYALENPLTPVSINRLFKKSLISAPEHNQYLMILNFKVDQETYPQIESNISPVPIGDVWHGCVMRTGMSNVAKYLFYMISYRLQFNIPDVMLRSGNWSSYDEMLSYITMEDYFSGLMRSNTDSVRAPLGRVITQFSALPEDLCKKIRYSDNVRAEFGTSFDKPIVLFNGINSFMYLDEPTTEESKYLIYVQGVNRLTTQEVRVFYNQDNRNNYFDLTTERISEDCYSITVPRVPKDSGVMFERLVGFYAESREEKIPGRLLKISRV